MAETEKIEPPDLASGVQKDSCRHLEDYLKVIEGGPVFPAFADNVRELLGIMEDPYYPVYEVSRIILRDVSLTTQVLKLVNTIYFQSRQRQVHTISNAVMLMGFEEVRDLAVGLMLFENFQKSASLDKVQKLICQSFFMAITAQELARQDHSLENEELFLTALLYNFGELVAAYYFPEKYQQVLETAQETQISQAKAVYKVFPFSLELLGEALLKNWNFPDTLCVRLADLKWTGQEAPGSEGKQRRFFRGIHEFSQALLNPDCSPDHRRKLQTKMARDLDIDPEIMAQSLAACTHRLQTLVRVLSLDGDLGLGLTEEKAEPTEADREQAEAAPDKAGKQAGADVAEAGGAADQELTRLNFLLQVIEEINQAIATRVPIHRIFMMILEGIFQGIGFDRVAFCMVDPKRTWINGRFGMGDKVEELLPLLKLPFASRDNPLSLSLAQAQEYLVCPESRPEDRQLMKEEFWEASQARAILVSPILIDAVPIGVIYMDRLHSVPAINARDRQRLQSFRDLAVIAIRLSSQRPQDGLSG